MVKEIEKNFLVKYKARPDIIISNISRKNVHHNRDIEKDTCGNKIMARPWNQFHDYVDTPIVLATKKFGNAIYIDLHGHGHIIHRLGLGYGLSADELRNLDNDTNNNGKLASKSFVTNLINRDKTENINQILIGDNTFGTLITKEGFNALPSKQDVAPLRW